MKKTIDEQGFTLVELMISIALLSLVLIMAYQFLYHGQTTTNRTQEKWLAERDVKNVSRVITQAIQLSYAATLSQNPLSETDKEFKNGKMFYFSAEDGTKGDLQFTDFTLDDSGNGVHTPMQVLNELPINVTFSNQDPQTGETSLNMLYISVKSAYKNSDYTLSTALYLPNIYNSVRVKGRVASTAQYPCLVFNVADTGLVDIGAANPEGNCFVATAAYGNYDAPMVILLRQFRDLFLDKFDFGKQIIQWYYTYSPPLAQAIAQKPVYQIVSRIFLLPVMIIAIILLHPLFSVAVLLFVYFSKKGLKYFRKCNR